jgi:phosphoribosylanthranilate isomerase
MSRLILEGHRVAYKQRAEIRRVIEVMAVKLKVCGVTSLEDARASIDCGAEYLGFNFYPKSPRYIAPTAARDIIERLPNDVVSVGVFVNEPRPEDVDEILRVSGALMAQLHGDESPAYCAVVGAERVIKALRAGDDFDTRRVMDYKVSAVLLDAFDAKLYGGTGRKANWAVAREAARLTKIFLAGGLSPENIAEAIRVVEPFAVDVNSGVESAPGRKDADKLHNLWQRMRGDDEKTML